MFCDILQALRVHEGITYDLKLFFTMSEEGLLIFV